MGKRKILMLIATVALIAALGITAFTVFADDQTPATDVVTDESTESQDSAATDSDENEAPGKRFRKELTDEEKAEIEAKREEMQAKVDEQNEKWDALTDDQKAEIYDLEDQVADLEGQIADKYQEFGIIDEEAANDMKERITEKNTKIKEDGRLPMMGYGKGMRGRCGRN